MTRLTKIGLAALSLGVGLLGLGLSSVRMASYTLTDPPAFAGWDLWARAVIAVGMVLAAGGWMILRREI